MAVQGRLKADQVSLAKFSIDRLRELPKIEVLAALTNSRTGQTHGWVDATAVQWSEKTNRAMRALFEAVEEDVARAHFESDSVMTPDASSEDTRGLRIPSGGIGEFLGTAEDVPSV
jgi:hypothetical protein